MASSLHAFLLIRLVYRVWSSGKQICWTASWWMGWNQWMPNPTAKSTTTQLEHWRRGKRRVCLVPQTHIGIAALRTIQAIVMVKRKCILIVMGEVKQVIESSHYHQRNWSIVTSSYVTRPQSEHLFDSFDQTGPRFYMPSKTCLSDYYTYVAPDFSVEKEKRPSSYQTIGRGKLHGVQERPRIRTLHALAAIENPQTQYESLLDHGETASSKAL